MSEKEPISQGAYVAVIGMAGRFPGARNLDEYWRNLAAGVESVKFFTDAELLAAGESPENLADPNYVRAWPVLEDIDAFDAGFFGMSPRDAAVMDPQHRLFLQVAWAAMEDAGYDVDSIDRPTGVYAANGMNTYMMFHLVTNREVMDTVGEWLVRHTGNDMNFLATRVSYQMNLKGPSMNVQTACSSSVVALHTAVQSLLNGECDMALAGASTLSLPQDRGYLFKEGEILSRDGHCRPFDAGSRGTLFGSGAGCVVLKRLSDAIADGDPIRAVVLGSAINNDGSLKVGYLAPSVDGQVRAVSEALAIAGVDPETINYIETHGTGTAIGDPIEITALTQAFRAHTDKRSFCAIGSVKANIGHLGEAAGMAGFIKTVLALQKKQIPPSINYEKPNPEIDFASSPVFVNAALTPWKAPAGGGPRRAGLTALGAGGTNAHMILEEAPAPAPSGKGRAYQLIALSARNEGALERATDQLAQHLRDNPTLALADVAYTLQVGRKQFAHRRTVVASGTADLLAVLEKRDPKRIATQLQSKAAGSIVFMFPGGGAQYAGMGAELYQTEPVYKKALDECLATLPAALATTVRGLLFPPAGELEAATKKLEQPSLTLPALFATEYAMARLLMSWGLEPAAMIGHSMGEYVAAALAGMISARDGMALVSLRGRLFETLPAGGMLSVSLSEADARAYLGNLLSIAAANAPNLCVVSGPVAEIERVEKELAAKEIDCTRIHISVAAHSQMLIPILAEFERFCRTIKLSAPTIPVMSNLTGAWITAQEATDPTYWVRHLRQTVRFAEGLAKVVEGESRVLLEVGPGRTLSSLARQQTPPISASLPTLRHPKEPGSDAAFLLQTIGKLWSYGLKPDWSLYHDGEQRRRLPLPTYPFEQQRYWIERGDPGAAAPKKPGVQVKKPDVADWFALPSWRRSLPPPARENQGPWLVFCEPGDFSRRVIQRLPGKVIQVIPGRQYQHWPQDTYRLRPGNREDYEGMIEDLEITGRLPEQIVHMWAVAPRQPWFLPAERGFGELERFDAVKERCFDSLLFLAQALSSREYPITLSVVSNGVHALAGESPSHPAQALLLGPTRVIPRELRHVAARNIDLHLGTVRAAGSDRMLDQLVTELLAPPTTPVVAYRGSDRWVQSFDPVRLEPTEVKKLRKGGVFLITGGLGGIGLELAEHLAAVAKARLVLIGRSAFPPRAEWERWLARHGSSDPTSQRIRRLMAIEAHGGEALVVSADVTDRVQMEGVISAARARFGAINGVIHSAGTIDDGLIALKSAEVAAGVIATKAKGAMLLDALLANDTLDFFLSCSSVSSILGLEGQIDYTAANAFLDAFARKKSGPNRPRTLSINWNAWQQIGMAVALAERGRGTTQATSGTRGPHLMLARLISDTAEESVFVTHFNLAEHWLLSEHVIRGADAVIPGTGYLELARAALAARPQARTVELNSVFFLAPFSVHGSETRTLKLKLARGADGGGEFAIFSRAEDAPHVTGRIGYVDAPAPARVDVSALLDRCREGERIFNGHLDQPFVDFGPRWANVEKIVRGKGEAVVVLSLSADFHQDLADIHLHPAMLDMATGGAQGLIPGFDQAKDFYVPFSYGKVRLYRPLPARAFSHVRLKQGGAGKELASFDIAILDAAGERVADIEDFTMKKIGEVSVMTDASRAAPTSQLGAVVNQGILPGEGMDAFDRILASPLEGQVVACSVDLPAWIERLEAESKPVVMAAGEAGAEGAGFSRPQLSTSFVAPRDQVEEQLAGMWRELLGVKEVGVNDDFFELGGQSLIAVRLFNKIRAKYAVDLPLSTLFEAPTIAGCAAIVREEAGIVAEAPATNGVSVATNGTPAPSAAEEPPAEESATEEGDTPAAGGAPAVRKKRWTTLVTMQGKGELPPFYCVAGMGGTLNNLRKLALLVGDARPFYGLQPPGADDPSQRLWRIEDLAEHYIKEVRKVQPHGPYLLGGYSGGGTVAFEMSKQLTAQGESIGFLGFIDSYSPDLPRRTAADRAKIHLKRVQSEGPNYVFRMVLHRWIHERISMQQRVTKQLAKVFPDKYRYENLQDAWAVAEQAYRPESWVGGRATLFRAREESAIGLWTGVVVDELHGWGRYLSGGVELQVCPGNHSTMCEEPHVRGLATKMRDALDKASPPATKGPAPQPAATL